MRTLFAVARKEFLENLQSGRFLAGAAAAIALALLATFAAADHYALRLESFRREVARHRADLEEATVYSYLQPVLVRPPEPLSILDQGFAQRLGTSVKIHIYEIPAAAAGEEPGNEFLAPLQQVDLTTIVEVVLGLLAVLLTFDAVARERAQGTLRLIFSYGVSPDAVLGGKILGGALAISLPLGACFLSGLGMLCFRAGLRPSVDQWLRLASLLGACFAYLLFMLLLGLLISLYARESARPLVLALFAWAALVFLVPGTARVVASDVIDGSAMLPELRQQAEALLAERDRWRQLELRRDPVLARFSGETPSFLSTAANGAVLRRFGAARYYDALARYYRRETALGMRYAQRVYALADRREGVLRSSARLATLLSLPSPTFLLDRLAGSFTGTSVEDQDRLLEAARAYRQRLIDALRARGAFGSWRWFTDDPATTHPWPSFLGLAPEEVDEGNIEKLFNLLKEPQIEARMHRAVAQVPRRLSLEDLPELDDPDLTVAAAWQRVKLEAALLAVGNALLVAAAVHKFRRVGGRGGN